MMEMRRTECNSELVRCEYKFTSSAITSDNEYKFRVEKRGNGNGFLQGGGQGGQWGPLGQVFFTDFRKTQGDLNSRFFLNSTIFC